MHLIFYFVDDFCIAKEHKSIPWLSAWLVHPVISCLRAEDLVYWLFKTMQKLPVVSVSIALNWNCFSTVFVIFLQQKHCDFFNIAHLLCSLAACLPCCFAYTVFLLIFSLIKFPVNSSRTYCLELFFSLLPHSFLTQQIQLVWFFPFSYSASCCFPGFLSLFPPSFFLCAEQFRSQKHTCDLCCAFAPSPFLLSSCFPPDIPLGRK